MKQIKVIMIYVSQDVPGFTVPFHFQMTKTFNLPSVPRVPCSVKLKDDAIEAFTFSKPEYDPEDDSYTVRNITYENVERYYSGDAEEIMKKVVKRYADHGWSWRKVMKKIYTD